MSDRFTIEPAPGTHVVRAGGAVIGETTRALMLRESGYKPVIYIPRADVAMAFLDRSQTETRCPHKGTASYYHIAAKSGPIPDAGWSYETPLPAAQAIAGHIAFRHEKVTVEQL